MRQALAALLLLCLLASPIGAHDEPVPGVVAYQHVPSVGPPRVVRVVHIPRPRTGDSGPMVRPLPGHPMASRPIVHVPDSPVIVISRLSSGDSRGHQRVNRGVASRMGSDFGRSYLALPLGPGHRVRICAARCWTMTSTDAGPDKAMQRAGRIADLNDWVWAYVTGLPLSRGLATVTVTYL